MSAGPTFQVATDLGRPVLPAARSLARLQFRLRLVAVALVAALLLVSTGATLLASVDAIRVPQQLDEGEPLVYGLAGRHLQREPLYQPIDHLPFVQVHYTPLYYWAVAELHARVAPGFGPGRVLSLLAGLVGAACVGYLAARRARAWWTGGFAIVLFLGLGFPGGPAPFLALVRVDVLGVGLSLLAIAVLAHGTSRLHLLIAGLLAGLALLTKQSLFGAALAGTLWLVTLRPRKAAVFAVVTALTAGVPAQLLQWSSHGAFWDNVGPANPSPTALEFGAYLFRELLVIQGVPTLLALLFVVGARAWREPGTRLLVLYWLATMPSVAGIIKVGANHNYWIELAAVNAVLATLAIGWCLRPRPGLAWGLAASLPIGLFVAHLAWLMPARFTTDRSVDTIPISWTFQPAPFDKLWHETTDFNQLVRDVGGERGLVLAESLDVAVLGDHPVAFEPFAFSMLEEERRWNSAPLVHEICGGHVTLLVLSYPMESDIHPVGLRAFPMWPNSVLAAIRNTMQLEQIRDFHWLYRSPPARDAGAIAACEAAADAAR